MKAINKILNRLLRREDGGALAELAILVPFLALMLASVAEFGRFFQQYTTLAKATRSASRYLSNHKLDSTEVGRAQSLVVCGKLSCGVGDRTLLPNLSVSNVCIESTGSPKVTSVTVKIPRTNADCAPMAGTNSAMPYTYSPIFNVGALLNQPGFTLALPLPPSTTMYYMID
ncbi:MAG TPA: TadE family protein [Pyrinomonadaceae bacterium]